MTDVVVYVHGKYGSAAEAERYKPLFPGREVRGVEYAGETPWEAGKELREAVAGLLPEGGRAVLIANSIGAYFSMHAGLEDRVSRAFFISPVVDMEKLITDGMRRASVTEAQLREKGVVQTPSGEALTWAYLRYVRSHPLRWRAPTEILYGARDELTSRETMGASARRQHAGLTVMEDGEHWCHTGPQRRLLDGWIREKTR